MDKFFEHQMPLINTTDSIIGIQFKSGEAAEVVSKKATYLNMDAAEGRLVGLPPFDSRCVNTDAEEGCSHNGWLGHQHHFESRTAVQCLSSPWAAHRKASVSTSESELYTWSHMNVVCRRSMVVRGTTQHMLVLSYSLWCCRFKCSYVSCSRWRVFVWLVWEEIMKIK